MGNIFHDNNGKLDEVSAYHPYDHSDDGSEYTSFFPSLGCDDRNQMGSTVKTRCSTAETDLDFPPTLGSVISHMPRKSTIEMQLKSLFFFPWYYCRLHLHFYGRTSAMSYQRRNLLIFPVVYIHGSDPQEQPSLSFEGFLKAGHQALIIDGQRRCEVRRYVVS